MVDGLWSMVDGHPARMFLIVFLPFPRVHSSRIYPQIAEALMGGSFQDLRVWQQAMKLAAEVYRATHGFPKHELYGITSQIRRAAVSVASNIAEGKGHRSDREFLHYLFYARGSLFELETQILLANSYNTFRKRKRRS
jgi:four helix bundle protein